MLSAKHGGYVSFITTRHVTLEADGEGWKQNLVIETELQLDATDDDYDEDAVADLMREAAVLREMGGFHGCTITTTKRWYRA